MPEADQTHTPVEQDPAEREALETKTATSLADIFKDGDDELTEGVPAKTSEEAKPEVEAEEEKPATAEEKTAEEKTEAAEETPAAKPTASATPADALVPAAYRRSLKAYQWTDEEIDAAAKANPAGFLKIAEKTHMARVEQTRQWAEAGRHAKTTTPAPATTEAKPKFDAAALRAKYGNESFIDAMEAQHAALEQANAYIAQSRERQAAAEMESLSKQIDGYFSNDELKPYHDHYGTAGKTLTESQVANRQKVLETADLLISGARSMGRPITLDEALTMAHDSVSGPIKAKVAVAKVATAVRKREAQISLRPGSRATTLPADTRKALETTVKTRLSKVFS